MNTKLVRLNSGEDIICDLIEDTDDSITMGSTIVAVPQGQGQLAFAPWSPLAKEDVTFTIPKSFVVYVSEPNPNITEQYEGMFSTVITPQKKIIL